jgi:hypothetical protein
MLRWTLTKKNSLIFRRSLISFEMYGSALYLNNRTLLAITCFYLLLSCNIRGWFTPIIKMKPIFCSLWRSFTQALLSRLSFGQFPFSSIVLTLYAVRSKVRVLSKFSMRFVLIFEYSPWLLSRSFLMYEYCAPRFSMRSVFNYEHYCPISLCDCFSCGITIYFVLLCGPFPFTSDIFVSLCGPFLFTSDVSVSLCGPFSHTSVLTFCFFISVYCCLISSDVGVLSGQSCHHSPQMGSGYSMCPLQIHTAWTRAT